jgi:NADPH-dependent 7-cyano-7-deazaguanine reductase QueF-like protein
MSDMADLFGVNSKYNSQKFQDLDLYNKDTKSILDEEGKIVFGYSFIDLRTLVFFTSDKSFKKILNSFQNNKKRK